MLAGQNRSLLRTMSLNSLAVTVTHQARPRATGNSHLRLLREAADSDSLKPLLSTS